MTAPVFPAFAKLNLFLHVTGRRPDGYHALQTVFQLVDLHDDVRVEVTDDGRIARDPPPDDPVLRALPDASDLTVRAALMLQSAGDVRQGARLHVHKRIPAGGGLGGGSADAATVLLALNQLWGLHWPRERLAELGLALGADVPVFVLGRSAWGEGRGEQLLPVDLPERWYAIVHPGVSVGTAEIFGAAELTRDTAPMTMRDFLQGKGRNDCEPVVRARYPQVAAALDWLSARAPGTRLTGTGACLFAPFESEQAARRVAAAVPAPWRAFVARGLRETRILPAGGA